MHKRTKALAIPVKVKKAVARRDTCDGWPCCIGCGAPVPSANPLAYSNAHVVPRSQGGRGIETNIVTLCPVCHRMFDEGNKSLSNLITDYMLDTYGLGWCLEDQKYRKEN